MKINLNDTIKVKMLEKGYKIQLKEHLKQYERIKLTSVYTLQDFKDKADPEGYVEFQMWCFMNTFGSYFGNGFPNICETEIILCGVEK